MSIWKGFVWAVGRNTEWGRKQLGQETLAEQTARELRLKQRLQGRWFSRYRENQGTIELMVDRDGNPTNQYPHVHVIHDEAQGEVRFVLSFSPHNHPMRETLPGTASGNEVNAAIDRMVAELRRR